MCSPLLRPLLAKSFSNPPLRYKVRKFFILQGQEASLVPFQKERKSTTLTGSFLVQYMWAMCKYELTIKANIF